MTLEPGDAAPRIAATNQHGETVSPDFSEPTVVYFYPRDGTPGCTTEADQFGRERETYREAGVAVYGVSTDDVDSHREFAERQGVGFDLLADPEGEVAAAFGVPVTNGRADRTTFVVDEGVVKAVYSGVDPDGHAREVMMDVLDSGLATLE